MIRANRFARIALRIARATKMPVMSPLIVSVQVVPSEVVMAAGLGSPRRALLWILTSYLRYLACTVVTRCSFPPDSTQCAPEDVVMSKSPEYMPKMCAMAFLRYSSWIWGGYVHDELDVLLQLACQMLQYPRASAL